MSGNNGHEVLLTNLGLAKQQQGDLGGGGGARVEDGGGGHRAEDARQPRRLEQRGVEAAKEHVAKALLGRDGLAVP